MAMRPRSITVGERTRTLAEWSRETGLSPKTICARLDVLGWPPEKALAAPPDRRFRKGGRPRAGGVRPVPVLRREPGTERAFVRWKANRKDHYRSFGAWGAPGTAAEYRRFSAEWTAGTYFGAGPVALTVSGLVASWLAHVDREYRKLGKRTSEYHVSRSATYALESIYGDTPAAEFTPAKFKAVRAAWVQDGKSRYTANAYAYRVERAFRWAAGESLIPPAVPAAITCVDNLKAGRTAAKELPPVEPVSESDVAATLAALPDTDQGRTVGAMIQVQQITGMRSQHLAHMKASDINRDGEVWEYLPPAIGTKTLHRGKRPRFFLGLRAQMILEDRLCGPTVFGYRLKSGRWVGVSPDRYGKAIARACERAGVPHWHPHQLRHAAATRVAKMTESLADAAALIGDNPETARAVYVHADPQERARRELAKRFG